MEFNYHRGFENTNMHQNQQVFRTSSSSSSSSSSYTYFSDQERFLSRRSEIEREIEKERICHEIIADELKRQHVLEAEVRKELIMKRDMTMMPLMLGPQLLRSHYHHHRFALEMMHGEYFVPQNRRIVMPLRKTYYGDGSSGGGSHRAETGGFEVVPFQRQPPSLSPKIKEITIYQPKDAKKEVVALAPFGSTASGLKRKLPTPPLSAAASSSGVPLDISKKKKEEWRCAICEVSATSENGLNDHIAGKKHQVKLAALKSGNNGGEIGLGKIKNSVKEQPLEIKNLSQCVSVCSKNEGESKPKNSRFWCTLCKAGAPDEKAFISHKKGKKHLKNLTKECAKNKTQTH